MDKNNKIKYDLLGMPFGTATNKLRKAIMFRLIQKLGEDICFRCGNKIENIEDLSIEHKTSWQLSNTPKDTFFDLENIAFSHLKCNINSAKRDGEKDMPIGKTGLRGAYRKNRNLKKPFVAQIRKNGRHIHIGYFETPEEASEAYMEKLKGLDKNK